MNELKLIGKMLRPCGMFSCLLSLTITLSGCSSVGPTRNAVMNAGKVSTFPTIRVVEVDDGVARRILASQTKTVFSETLGDGHPSGTIVGTGDLLEVNLWEAPPAALFGSSGVSAKLGLSNSTSQATTLPEQRVNEDGGINIPFVGSVQAAGRSTDEIAKEIVRRLSGKAHQPQAIVRIVQNTTASVTIVGEVKESQIMPLTARGERLLDALALAGGVVQPINKVTLQITRGQTVESMPMDQVIADPKQNVILQRGDVVTALFQPFSFTALGASGRNDELPFEASGITLAQALGRIGGLQDQRSDARGVFVFRFESPLALGLKDIKGVATTPEDRVPVIYRVDLKNPNTFFVAQNFPIKNKDIIYVSNAPLADIQKFVGIVSSVVFPIVSVENATSN